MPEKTTKTAEFRLNILLENTEGVFVGWCIETGINATAPTENECVNRLMELNCEHISFALENDNPKDIFSSAPTSVMNKFLLLATQEMPRPESTTEAGNMKCLMPTFALHPAIYAAASI